MPSTRWQTVSVLVFVLLVVGTVAAWMFRAELNLFWRSTDDQPDESEAAQIHVMYVLPSDGKDERLDVNGTLATSVEAFQRWLAGQTGGRRLRMDTLRGALDITFVRLPRTDLNLSGFGLMIRDQIEMELKNAGFNRTNKIYAVYYGGTAVGTCGGGAWPPTLVGNVAATYLFGSPSSGPRCEKNRFAADADTPGYREFGMLHEILHTIGVVATCALNHTMAGHVSDSPTDLMYAGSAPWNPSVLDVGRDDYYGHGRPGCLDFSASPYLH